MTSRPRSLSPAVLLIVTLLLHAASWPLMAQPDGSDRISQLAELTASDGDGFEEFGASLAISGNTVVVGAPRLFQGGPEGAYVFQGSAGSWIQVAKLTDNSGDDGPGTSVATNGKTIAVGAVGAAYVFVEPAGGWHDMTPTATFTVAGGQKFLGSGIAISSDGTTIVAGASGDGGLGSGAAYVFVKPAGGWQDTSVPTATLSSTSAYDLGISVAIDGSTVVAGSTGFGLAVGPAYVFVKPPTGWQDAQPTAALTPSDQVGNGGQFSKSVAISGNTVVAGAPVSLTSGTAYVFVEPHGGWQDMTQTAELTVSSRTYNSLGYSVVIVGNAVVAGAPTDVIGNTRKGAAFGYLKPSGGWQNTSKPNVSVIASDGAAKDGFGTSVALSSTIAVIGAPQHAVNGQTLQGAAYVFGQQ
jgi:hypothetical protein